ncbi:MAG: thiopeptide-type bacteriocin biosynthesis protein [Saprospiraceae bacterium]|jgi:thiopeptide-type bacteriocin biosynthesis protein
MPKPKNENWLSVHLFYNEPWETFLVEAVAPYVETVLKTGIAQSYFFVRYWKRGPHIRLRFKGEPKALEEVLKPNLLEHFNSYFEDNPSIRTEPEYPEDLPLSQRWLPNNSIQVKTYLREYGRYGGSSGMILSEEQFQLSSATVLDYFSTQEDAHAYHEILGAAIRLHISFVYSIGLSVSEAVTFFELIFENWLPAAFEIFENNTPEEVIREKLKETMALFYESFEEQTEDLIPFHQNLWDDLKSGDSFESDALNNWIQENQRLSLELSQAAETGELSPRTDPYILSEAFFQKVPEKNQLLWHIFADYVHMTNNRLGILNQDEAYLAYLMMKSLNLIEE